MSVSFSLAAFFLNGIPMFQSTAEKVL